MPTDDTILIAKAKADAKAFGLLYSKYKKDIYRYFWYRVNFSKSTADDLTQETFFRAYKALPNFTIQQCAYLTYLLRIAHNLLANYYRSNKPLSLKNYKNISQEYEQEIIRKLDFETTIADIQKLPKTQAEAIKLYYVQDQSIKEIALILNKSSNAVKLLLSRARKKLRAM